MSTCSKDWWEAFGVKPRLVVNDPQFAIVGVPTESTAYWLLKGRPLPLWEPGSLRVRIFDLIKTPRPSPMGFRDGLSDYVKVFEADSMPEVEVNGKKVTPENYYWYNQPQSPRKVYVSWDFETSANERYEKFITEISHIGQAMDTLEDKIGEKTKVEITVVKNKMCETFEENKKEIVEKYKKLFREKML